MHNLYACIVKFVNTGRQFGQYLYKIWPIPVDNFANTGEGTFSKIWEGLRSKSGILKTWGVLELCLDMGSRIKKIDLATEMLL